MNDLDEPRLEVWLQAKVPGFPKLVSLEKFSGGQSNPTYRVETEGQNYVLRRKPFGPLLPSAHAIEREFHLLSALRPTGFPVPAPIALCEDASIIGSPFYLMELVEGRTFWDGSLPLLSALVVLKESGWASGGFFKLARRAPYKRAGDDVLLWTREIEKLAEHYADR